MLCDRIVTLAVEAGGERTLDEVIIGLGFTLTRLDNGGCGLAYTLREDLERGCDAFEEAGGLRGRVLQEVLPWICGSSVISSAVGLAAANAVLLPPDEAFRSDLLDLLELQPGESVVTVGRFRPMEPKLEQSGVRLHVIEREDSHELLSDCDVALITATSIINNSLENILGRTGGAREVVILGTSTPYAPSAFSDTPVTAIAGSVVSQPEKVYAVVSEGGGTRTMGKALSKWVTRVGKR